MWLTRTNLIHSLKTHCFNCVKQSYRLRVIFYLRKFCSLDTNNIKFLMSWSNRCYKSVWIYYYYNHIKLIISFNLRLKNFNLVFRFFISVFMLKISIFRLCIIILCYFSSFLMLLTSKTCFHIALCASKTSAIYIFNIIKTLLFFFCILTIMMTIRSIFVFFNALFIESRIFIIFKVQFSFLRLTMNLLSWYDFFVILTRISW